MAVWTLFFSSVLLPLFSLLLLWRRPRVPRGGWIATLLMAVGLCAFSLLAAPWGWFGFGARIVIAVLFVAAVVASLRRPVTEERPALVSDASPLRAIVKVLIGVMFGSVALGVLRAHAVPPGAIDLRFPLRDGTYLVQHGGSESAANIHAPDPQQRYGLDVVKLNRAGTRARGFYPRDLARYAIWGAEVLSPCNGTVVSAVDGLPDQRPGTLDPKNAAGNHVVLRCGDAGVTLAHLQRGSVRVRPGAAVAEGTLLGRVGNSGNTTEPHLHVHAERGGKGVPARFNGRWLVRNAIVRN